MRKVIATEKAPAAIGPYAQANVIGNLVFTSGQLGIVPETGDLAEGLEAQTRQALDNLKHILEEAGSSLEKTIKTTCFMDDMNDFAAMNAIYAEYFNGDFPSRSAVQVAALPKGGLFEIEAIAYIE
ncbi:MAG: RidA family protein [Clostridia bacterium]|nr:RidA family protein [Clostridia bacterium]